MQQGYWGRWAILHIFLLGLRREHYLEEEGSCTLQGEGLCVAAASCWQGEARRRTPRFRFRSLDLDLGLGEG